MENSRGLRTSSSSVVPSEDGEQTAIVQQQDGVRMTDLSAGEGDGCGGQPHDGDGAAKGASAKEGAVATPFSPDPFYDSGEDDRDREWVENHFYGQHDAVEAEARSGEAGGVHCEGSHHFDADTLERLLGKTDAVLNCPGCFTTVCIHCQRHELYAEQFRAMFVRDCRVAMNERLLYEKEHAAGGGGRRRKRKQKVARTKCLDSRREPITMQEHEWGMYDTFHPVYCVQCGEELGLFDYEDVYHFHNVFVSH
eukprot:TRINITY_DN6561_c0_g1_i1.p1 TRINITY_DN6561_c0_g1~~TRINITY_DN6561_c0_g1_i1.p1  ORF type:complete len:252 (+),score=67.42 TRINITY_DN6561_c0_g1_i1:135-890(+)